MYNPKMKKSILCLTLLTLLTTTLLFPNTAFALTEFPMEYNIPNDRIWTVKFSFPVYPLSISETSFTVRDSNNNLVPTTLSANPTFQEIYIIGKELYKTGETYTLYVCKDGLREKYGTHRTLLDDVSMKFQIKN